jgi:hypothetical protein
MNYERFKKIIVSLALMCVFAFSTLVANVVPANAQWYQRQYVYSYPYVYYPYSYQPYNYYPYGYYPRGYYPYGYNPYRHHRRHRDVDFDDILDWLF